MNVKMCSKCKTIKPLDEFYKSKGKHRFGVRPWCKNCSKQDPVKARENELKRKYSLSIFDYERMYIKQSGKCFICGKKKPTLFIDHDHTNGKVRGLLCPGCNTMLGHIKDDINTLEKAKQYLLLNRY